MPNSVNMMSNNVVDQRVHVDNLKSRNEQLYKYMEIIEPKRCARTKTSYNGYGSSKSATIWT